LKPNQSVGMTLRDPQNPHGTARAARGHARLSYAGGSWRSPEPVEVDNPEAARIFNRQLVTRRLGKRRNVRGRNDANHHRHVPTRLFDVLGKRAVIVIYGMRMYCSVGMSMRHAVAMMPAVCVLKSKGDIIMARIAGRGFRGGHKDSLEGKSQRGRHHQDGGDLSTQRLPGEVQLQGSSIVSRGMVSAEMRQDKGLGSSRQGAEVRLTGFCD
jgi:hypothetical protein